MKKLISVFVLVSFLGSMLVMTGCFGGDDGLAAVVGVLAIGLIITASTGGAGVATFAANQRVSLRPAVSIANNSVNVKIFPMDATGAKVGTGTTYDANLSVDQNGNLTLSVPSLDVTSYNQYSIEVYSGDKLLLKRISYFGTSEKTGTHNVAINPETTAKALIYENWNANSSSRTYAQFEYNLGNTDISADTTAVQTMVTGFATDNTQNVDLTTIPLTTTNVTTTPAYKVSGYVYSADNSGQTDCNVNIYSDEARQNLLTNAISDDGRYSINLPDGTYYFEPVKANHSYDPALTKVVVSGADQSGINFKAKTASTSSNRVSLYQASIRSTTSAAEQQIVANGSQVNQIITLQQGASYITTMVFLDPDNQLPNPLTVNCKGFTVEDPSETWDANISLSLTSQNGEYKTYSITQTAEVGTTSWTESNTYSIPGVIDTMLTLQEAYTGANINTGVAILPSTQVGVGGLR